LLKNINLSYYKELVEKEIIIDGMIPKLDNCFYALKNEVNNVSVGGHDIIKNNFTNITLD
jgi:acetylglutamate kinase